MEWVFLGVAIALEVVATSLLKSTEGFTRLWPTVACLVGYAGAFYALTLSLRELQVGTAYAMWSGIGTAAIATIGVVFLHEPLYRHQGRRHRPCRGRGRGPQPGRRALSRG